MNVTILFFVVCTWRPDRHNSGVSPPPFGLRSAILLLISSASVVLKKGPKSAFKT